MNFNNCHISNRAIIGKNTVVRDFSLVEDDVVIGKNVVIGPNAFIGNGARISDNVKILHSSSISIWPNSIGYNNEETITEIGEGTIIKGLTTICRGTKFSNKTTVGKNCYLMNHVHIAHDNIIGDNTILTNGVNLGGHVEIGHNTIIGGLTAVHQFCHIGDFTMIEAQVKIDKDVPPFVLAGRKPLRFLGINITGLKRNGFTKDRIDIIRNTYEIIYNSGLNVSDSVKKIKGSIEINDDVQKILYFIDNSNRGIIRK